jgi:hypothetical protein
MSIITIIGCSATRAWPESSRWIASETACLNSLLTVCGLMLALFSKAAFHQQQGCAVLMISHDLHRVMKESTQVLCLYRHICCICKTDAKCEGWSHKSWWRALSFWVICAFENPPSIPIFLATQIIYIGYGQFFFKMTPFPFTFL